MSQFNPPDVNKLYPNESRLCWAAAASNALAYTGWADEEACEVFAKFKQVIDNVGGWGYEGLILYAKTYLRGSLSFPRHIKILPPSFLWLCAGMRNVGACALITLRNSYFENGHVVTAYDAILNDNYDNSDVRTIDALICTDSDDNRSGTTNVSLTYNLREKKLYTDYRLNEREAFIMSATVLYPRDL